MPIKARKLIRKMRGGAQAHLIEAETGDFYVVKFINNPQHRRILVNEWLAGVFLRYLQIHTPDNAAVELTPEFIEENPDLYLTIGPRREAVPPGIHFGSRLSVHPERVAIYDFLPDKLLDKVENLADFLGVLVFDKWVGNADSRQAVFFRARGKKWTPIKGEGGSKTGFYAQMIDHGFAFSGSNWQFQDSPLQGLYFRTSVYREVSSLDSFQPWLSMVESFPTEVLDQASRELPQVWMEDDGDQMEAMLERLVKRRTQVARLLEEIRDKRASAFPNWT